MKITAHQHRPLGRLDLRVPPIVFGTAALGNVPQVIPEQRKLAICGEWFRHVEPPVFVDLEYEHGDGSAMESLGRILRRLDVTSGEVLVHLSIDSTHAMECWEKSCRLLGDAYRPKLITVRNVNEDEWQAVRGLKQSGLVRGVGIFASSRESLSEHSVDADWVWLRGGLTLLHHPTETTDFLNELAGRQTTVIVSGIFAGGFLTGGNSLNRRTLHADDPADRSLLAWRKSFVALCQGHGVSPAQACVQFALAASAVVAVELESTTPDQVAENVDALLRKVPDAFWASMKEERLLSEDYPYLNSSKLEEEH
ncbi:MAG TPA: aldo/keto reductase [Lacipirellulaceae bacterium]|nr:aldo/keto reductase [Lacipirellulaceae bacterium]